ncbi:putative pentatricopeptide repeat-containing protein At1g53330 [Salvia splendens]|uniref:putative pentatricopeptide repeat-containing protein At1g53330 n=1 Tax=Salvia splendens TaxID=180675 RepID=UPI001C257AB9|nr:putative pentatricopeptide repeat-containing protein At1g53330 [Salvia splendens]XP_042022063.1 putative pentatricopeptide repeat-containing protein At1g53330 [Salvia splendens]XP_042022064.1 putative pentatricopeptide repeat-containing protein At1g53330 [Salvia splendens]XP_042022065.1 putative pentatricopeptide repeat-containing protein At1g53330 [Salvia splendens]
MQRMKKKLMVSPFTLSSLLRREKDPKLALQLFLNPNPHHSNAKPFRHSLLSYDLIISKLGRAKMFSEMEIVMENLKKDTRISPEEIIFCNIMTFYARSRLPSKALHLFDEIPSYRCRRTVKSVNTLLNGLLVCHEFDKMMEVYDRIEDYGSPDACTYNILINAFCVMVDLVSARKVFDEMLRRGVEPNVVTFGTLINGLCANSELDAAFSLKRRMERDFKIRPNAHIYIALMKGLCRVFRLDEAIRLKGEMLRKKVELVPAVYSTLISASFKANRKGEVSGLLEEMRGNGCKPDTITYNAMIHGYCKENEFGLAFGALSEMEKDGCKPDVISFNVIIGGLCRERKEGEAYDLLEDMPRRGCAPDVVAYRTVFDGFCDVKQFKEAASILDEMSFMGYAHHTSSVSKCVDALLIEENKELLLTYVFMLVKRNSLDRYIWKLVTCLLFKDSSLDVQELFDGLINSHFLPMG